MTCGEMDYLKSIVAAKPGTPEAAEAKSLLDEQARREAAREARVNRAALARVVYGGNRKRYRLI